ncbi:hypothetical protein T552_01966 [Pneumocystis carinii B80]|uniref:Uncharacterized protein n=1 Tax=Pneumocystis carinii (strain B80) TaxID=1408658 RepID=A0A0W4ZIA5_PNEC8|nr:hypothetical protein T552_01966 [Pneumocystis carinii B80]KTW28105.1 hypothetical protein T552_01966 [Pneumocystis carinii B80]
MEKEDIFTSVFQQNQLTSFKDVTKEFFEALKDLSLGELVHDSSFSLEDSISALEMMDPKMDNSLEIDNEVIWDVEAELEPYKVLGLIDKTFAAEISWQSGYFLSQTVFTNVYIQKLLLERQGVIHINDFYMKNKKKQTIYKDLVDVVIWPFMIASIKTCGIFCQTFSKGTLYEEEEVSFNTYGLSLLDNIDTVQILDLLEFSISWLDSHSSEFEEKDHKYIEVIRSRLETKISFLRALNSSSAVETIKDLEYLINKENLIFDFGKEMDIFFSISVQAKLSTTMPPRPIMILPMDIVFNDFKHLCEDFRGILLLSIANPSTLTPSNILNFFRYFRAKKPTSGIFVRTMLQTLFFSNNNMILNKYPIHQFIMDSISEIYSTKELFNVINESNETYDDSTYCIFNSINNFIKTATPVYINIFRTMCHNLSRQHQNFCKLILDLEFLQTEAENIDMQLYFHFFEDSIQKQDNIYPNIFTSWCYYEKLQIMILICFLGFELELHSSHELSLIYRYLDYLLKIYQAHLNEISSYNIRFSNKKYPTICFSEKSDTILATQQMKFDQDWTNGLQLLCNSFYKVI